jgi:hypothetical protein
MLLATSTVIFRRRKVMRTLIIVLGIGLALLWGNPVRADLAVVVGDAVDLGNGLYQHSVHLVADADRYSYSYDGTAQLLDHVIVNGPALKRYTRMHFARMHVFPYSIRSGTEAAKMDNQVPDAVKKERARQMLALARESAAGFGCARRALPRGR